MEPFEYFVEKQLVRKIQPDVQRAKSLIKDAESRIKDCNILDINKLPKIFFEHIYDVLRDLLDAILLLDGWKSYSHESSIVYLERKGFAVDIINELDNFRYKRNGSKYYGVPISVEEAKDIKAFYLKIKDRLNKLLST